MKLYDVPRESSIRVYSLEDGCEEVLKFINLDGMYSLCIDKEGNFVHLAAWTDVEVVVL